MSEKTKNKKYTYGFEIAMLKNQTFDPELLEKFKDKTEATIALKGPIDI